ncbi:MAG: helix-turn-helix domain-containing protein, partial [Patescibacteria group bacterium]
LLIDTSSNVWYKIVMDYVTIKTQVYTPEQVADILQLSKNTVYQLINRGEIIAKKLGKVYRIPASSISFAFTGLDYDLFKAQKEDLKNIKKVQAEVSKARKSL